LKKRIGLFLLVILFAISCELWGADGKVLIPQGTFNAEFDKDNPKVHYHGWHSLPSKRNLLDLKREMPWGLPKVSKVQANGVDTLKLLGLRFDFQHEDPDDPNTTGRGKYDFRDTLTFFEEEGHAIDPSPHNRAYFEKHFEALDLFYRFVSEGQLVLIWDVFPEDPDSVYHLPREMAHYGQGTNIDEIIGRLIDSFFVDCFKLADTSEPAIVFSDYDSYFLFHAGSDRQNDIGFPSTQADLFTCYATRGDDRPPLYVDEGATLITDALIMPETASQDNRATALNAVMAHEFGHQLGLVDLYRTDNFFTQLGDFAMMDNNGFGTGIDFGFEVGRAFGTMPVYPMAWSRAFLGFEETVIFHKNADIEIVAGEMVKDGIEIAKIPINDYEYYLIENRQIEIDGKPTALLADSVTGVIQGPVSFNQITGVKTFSGEYDFLMPGSGILIWHVDERVAAQEYQNSGYTNFELNRLQLNPDHRFIELMEADGLVNFGGNFYAGFGSEEDMYQEGNNSSFTPNTNPPSIGYFGINSHIYITDISASDTAMTFGLEFDHFTPGFPRRAGYPAIGISPIADDVDGDGLTEIIAVSNRNLLAVKENGAHMFRFVPLYYDTSYSSTNRLVDSLPLLGRTSEIITAGPVVGDFEQGLDSQLVAVAALDTVYVHTLHDDDFDGLGDYYIPPVAMPSVVVWASFDRYLDVAAVFTDAVQLFSIDENGDTASYKFIPEPIPYGFARIGNGFAAIAGDSAETYINLHYVKRDSVFFAELNDFYSYGPVIVDLNRDSLPEVILASPYGSVAAITIDTSANPVEFITLFSRSISDTLTSNPIVADIDDNGYADIIVGGKNRIHVLDRNLIPLTGFPIEIDRGLEEAVVVSTPVAADIDGDDNQDILVLTSVGNLYAFGPELLFGFPLGIGGVGVNSVLMPGDHYGKPLYRDLESPGFTSPLMFENSRGGGLAVLAGDGWIYSYDIVYDADKADWPMYGGDPSGSFQLPGSKLSSPAVAEEFPAEEFICYPNPTRTGMATIRFFLGSPADVNLKFYDFSGKLVGEQDLDGQGGVYNEFTWNGSNLATGVYRCYIEADFGGVTHAAYKDIAIVK